MPRQLIGTFPCRYSPLHVAIWQRCHSSGHFYKHNRRVGRLNAAFSGGDLLSKAIQFYEVAWGGDMELMESLVAEDHIQRDMVWQENPGVGREKLVGGVQRFRSIYPDIAFHITEACACSDSNKVFVHWTMTGTFEGESSTSSGISLLKFDSADGRIAETCVYRQALPAEVLLAQRSTRIEPVKQGILLDQRTRQSSESGGAAAVFEVN